MFCCGQMFEAHHLAEYQSGLPCKNCIVIPKLAQAGQLELDFMHAIVARTRRPLSRASSETGTCSTTCQRHPR